MPCTCEATKIWNDAESKIPPHLAETENQDTVHGHKESEIPNSVESTEVTSVIILDMAMLFETKHTSMFERRDSECGVDGSGAAEAMDMYFTWPRRLKYRV